MYIPPKVKRIAENTFALSDFIESIAFPCIIGAIMDIVAEIVIMKTMVKKYFLLEPIYFISLMRVAFEFLGFSPITLAI